MEPIFDLISKAGDGAFAIDRSQRIVFWNDACESILGFPAAEVVGKPCYEVISGRTANGCRICRDDCLVLQACASRMPIKSRDVRATTKSGRSVWLNVSTIAVPSVCSELSALLHLVRDITARKKLERSVEALADEFSALSSAPDEPLPPAPQPSTWDLTTRERDILRELGRGAATSEIAERLCIAKTTTRNHIHNVILKLGVRNRLEAVIVAIRTGLV